MPDFFDGVELVPLCMTIKMSEARRIESALDSEGIDYTFEITPAVRRSILSIIFGSAKKGVMFLVPEEKYGLCRTILEREDLSHLFILD